MACTLVAKPNLAHARVLAASWREQQPEVPFVVGLTDEPEGCFDPAREPFEVVELARMPFAGNAELRFRHRQQELSYAATPFLLEYLLDRGARRVLFFKQESLVLAPHDITLELLNRHAILLTPHLLDPLEGTDAKQRELGVIAAGTFNLGFLGVSEASSTRAFLRWWQTRLRRYCEHAVARGVHFEQRWINLVPGLFDGVHVLRDPAASVGHWSFPERRVELDGDEQVKVDGSPSRLFRFSGYDPDRPDALTRYDERLTTVAAGAAGAVFERYRSALQEAGHATARAWPYAYDRFDNGVAIADTVRELHAGVTEAESSRFGDPFRTGGERSFWRWLTGPDEAHPALTRLWAELRRRRPDVAAAYPRPDDDDRLGFRGWAENTGRTEHGIPDGYPVLAS